MSVRPTSLEAWLAMQADGGRRLSELHRTALKTLWEVHPKALTGKEMDQIHGSDSYHKRMSELKDWGVATDLAEGAAPGSKPVKRQCTVTGAMVVEWRATFAPLRSQAEYDLANAARQAQEEVEDRSPPRRAAQEARREEQLLAVVAALRAYTTGDRCNPPCRNGSQRSLSFEPTPRALCRFCAGIEALRQVER